MDGMVTARVPIEVKERVNALLRERGSSPTELVNAAYAYYLSCGELPQAPGEAVPTRVALTRDQARDLRARLAAARCPLPASYWSRIGGDEGWRP